MLYVLLVAFVVQLFFWGYFLRVGFRSRDAFPDKDDPERMSVPVSIIVCFRNEADVLEDCLTGLLDQRYVPENFEVVAVDDGSTDGSAAIVRRLQQAFTNLRYLQAGPTRPGKKEALALGIREAKHDVLLLTDADCVPRSPIWLYVMTDPFRRGAEVVLGVSLYGVSNMGLLNHFQNYEARYVAMTYCGFTERGMPYMGVGRNLAYHRSLFERAGGFTAHAHLPGGDDDLIIGHHAIPEKTVCVTHVAGQTVAEPYRSWKDFLGSRQRHQTVGGSYRPKHQALLGLLGLSHGLFYLLGFLLLFTEHWRMALIVYVLRFALVYYVNAKAMRPPGEGPSVVRIITNLLAAGVLMGLDALLAVQYLYLTVVGWWPRRSW